MSTRRLSAAIAFCCLWPIMVFSADSSIPTYYMDGFCGNSISMQESMLLDLTAQFSYDSDMRCVLTIQTMRTFMDRLMVRVRWIDVEGPFYQCEYDRLIIYDGMDTYAHKITGSDGICGNRTSTIQVYRTSSSYVTFNFTSDSSVERKGFELLITAFDDSGYCVDEYECDNGDCVDETLECDGYKNCLTADDEDSCGISREAVTAITAGCVGFSVLIAGFIVLAMRNRRSPSTPSRPAVTERSSLVGNTGPYTVQTQVPGVYMPPPAYSSVYPAQAPGTAQGLPVTIQEVVKE